MSGLEVSRGTQSQWSRYGWATKGRKFRRDVFGLRCLMGHACEMKQSLMDDLWPMHAHRGGVRIEPHDLMWYWVESHMRVICSYRCIGVRIFAEHCESVKPFVTD